MTTFEGVAETVDGAVLRHDSEGEITYASSTVSEQFGYPSADLVGTSIRELVPSEKRARALAYRDDERVAESPFETETTVVGAHGNEHPVMLRATASAESGEVVVILRDIRKQKQQEQYLQFTREVTDIILGAETEPALLRSVIDTVTDRKFGCTSIALLNKSGGVEEIYGTMENWCEMDWESVYTPEYVADVLSQGDVTIEDTTQGRHRQHTVDSVDHGAIALALSHRDTEYGVLTMHLPERGSELSEHERDLLREFAGNISTGIYNLRTEAELRDSKKQLTVLDRILRHNLRNELTVVIGAGEELAVRLSDEEQSLAASIPERSQRLLDIAEKEREVVELVSDPPEVTTIELAPLVERSVSNCIADYPAAECTTEVPDGVSIVAIREIEQALTELIENAFVHIDQQPPRVTITATEVDGRVAIEIADNGPGIPSQETTVLTEGRAIDSLYHGSGLGLWLVNWIVKRSDGYIQFREGDSGGSVVTITLPQSVAKL